MSMTSTSMTKASLAVLAALALATPAMAQNSGGGNSGSTPLPKECPAGAPNCVEQPPQPGQPNQ